MNDTVITTIILFLPLLIAGGAGIFWFMRWSAGRRWLQHRARTVESWEAEGVTFVLGPVGGQFVGLESMGVSRIIRGVGLVAITPQDLRVTRLTPEGVWMINHRQIKGISLQSTFMGNRGQKVPLIVARFVQDGQSDKLAFQVSEFESWAETLAKQAGVSVKDKRQD